MSAKTVFGPVTVDDLETFPNDGNRYEIIDGELNVSPAPHQRHQRMQLHLSRMVSEQVDDRGIGWVYPAPVDVRFSPLNQVQPDIIVLLNGHESIYRGCTVHGAPDLVVEIVSPGSQTYDQKVKFGLYERNGVPEYWIADPVSNSLRQFVLRDARFTEVALEGGKLRSVAIPGLVIDVPALIARIDRLPAPADS